MEHPVIDHGCTFRFAGRRYRIFPKDVKAGMRRPRLRIELRLSGEIKARYEGPYVEIAECDAGALSPKLERSHQPARKNHNAGARSHWMDGFFDGPSPELWQAIEVSNARN